MSPSVLVIGASRGIGRAIAEDGCHVGQRVGKAWRRLVEDQGGRHRDQFLQPGAAASGINLTHQYQVDSM